MTNKICLFLIVCLVFSCYSLPIAALDEESVNAKNDEEVFSVNLLSSGDFYLELEKEGINVEDSEEYNISLLIEVAEDSSVDLTELQASNIIANDNEIDEAILQHRNMVKNYYSEHNQSVVDELLLNECNYYVSFYAPYIEVIFDDVAEYAQYEEAIIDVAAQRQDIVVSLSNFAVLEQGFDEATINNPYSAMYYPFDEALVAMGVEDYGFTGAGIKVGVIEKGYPSSTINLKPNLYTFLGNESTSHCLSVTSIIGGNTGIAQDVYLYCLSKGSSFTDDCNTLINTYGVDIINMSGNEYICGYYTNCDAYIDGMISRSGCTFVKSAGNVNNNDGSKISSPGCSLNAITVGSIDLDKNVSSFSCWVTNDTYLLKPDVVAPGRIDGIDNVGALAGTSYAAPMVTGVIALLMEEFAVLKTNPALVKSVLHLGAESLPSQTSNFDQQAGFGLINYQNMRTCLQNAHYADFHIQTTADAGTVVLSKNVTIPYFDSIAVNANTIVNSSTDTSSNDQTTPTYTDYSIKIYDVSTSTCVATSSIDSTVDYLMYTNNNPNNSSFRIEIVLAEDSASVAPETGALSYEIKCHEHSYPLYTYYNNSSHIGYCLCGAFRIEGHYIRLSDISNNRYAKCLGCRAQLDLFEDTANTIMSPITQVTINGSYVLPSGIVVLVDEDIQAYLDGTLVFYHPDNIPTTQ